MELFICEGTAKRIGGKKEFGNLCFPSAQIKLVCLYFDFSEVSVKVFGIMAKTTTVVCKALMCPHFGQEGFHAHRVAEVHTSEQIMFLHFPSFFPKNKSLELTISRHGPFSYLEMYGFFSSSFLPKEVEFMLGNCTYLGEKLLHQSKSCFQREGSPLLEEIKVFSPISLFNSSI